MKKKTIIRKQRKRIAELDELSSRQARAYADLLRVFLRNNGDMLELIESIHVCQD